jgi:hypothetical protein
MDTEDTTSSDNDYFESGYVAGLLVARQLFLKSSGANDPIFHAPAPLEASDTIQALLSSMPRAAVNARLFESGWKSLDRLLLSESPEELKNALLNESDARLQ